MLNNHPHLGFRQQKDRTLTKPSSTDLMNRVIEISGTLARPVRDFVGRNWSGKQQALSEQISAKFINFCHVRIRMGDSDREISMTFVALQEL